MNVGELIIRIGADTGDLTRGARRARREIDDLPDEHIIRIRIEQDRIDQLEDRLVSSRAKLGAFISLLPILAAGLQVAAGAAGGLASMLGAATLGTAGFASVAVANLNDVFDAQTAITKANEDMAKASTLEEQKTAAENLAKAYKGLNQGQLAALGSMQKFKSFWDDFSTSFQAPVVVAFSQALDGLRFILESIGPAIRVTGNAIVTMFQRANEAMRGSDFTNFFSWLEKNVGSTIMTFGYIFMDTMQGVMNLMVAFQPISDSMQGGMRGMAQAFLAWTQGLGQSQAFKEFIGFVIGTGPLFLDTIKQLVGLLVLIIRPLSFIGVLMLGVANITLAVFNTFTRLIFGVGTLKSNIDSLTGSFVTFGNALKSLVGGTASTFKPDQIIDVDGAFKDWFDSIGNVTTGLEDAKKASDNFIQSFDEVHNINPNDTGGGGKPILPTLPTLPTLPSGGGGGTIGNDAETGTNWLQKLIDKIKEIPPLIPMRIDPPDAGSGAVVAAVDAARGAVQGASVNMVLAFQAVIAKMQELPSVAAMVATAFQVMAANMQNSATSVQVSWHGMLDYMQSQLNAYSPYLTFGWDALLLTIGKLKPSSEATSAAWHTMLDYMQNQLNAYRPYLEYGFALIGLALTSLVSTMSTTVTNWQIGWQAISNAVSAATSPILSMISSVMASYASLMAMMSQPIVIPPIKLPEMPKIEMPQIITDIQNTLKDFDYGKWFQDSLKGLGEAGLDMVLAGTGLKGAQLTGKAAEMGWPAFKSWLEGLMSGAGKAVTGFASGGIIGSDSIVRVGEQGRKEAIIPLESNAMQPFASAIASNMGGGGGNQNGDIVIQVDGVTLARVMAPYNIKESARIGGSMITTT